jgi:hypothetical protein
MAASTKQRALLHRIEELEEGLRNILGMAEQFDADPEFRTIAQIAGYLLDTQPGPLIKAAWAVFRDYLNESDNGPEDLLPSPWRELELALASTAEPV